GSHHRRAEEAEGARFARRGDQLRRGDPAHGRLDDGIAAAEAGSQFGIEGHALPSSVRLLPAAMALPSSPPRLLPLTRSFWAWAKWCMWKTASIAVRLPRRSSTWFTACLVSDRPRRGRTAIVSAMARVWSSS